MERIKLTLEQEQFLQNACSQVKSDVEGASTYYYMPFWWEKLPDGNWRAHNFTDLPPDLKQVLWMMREHSYKPVKPRT